MLAGNLQNRIHIGRQAEQMDGDDGARAGSDACRDLLGIQIKVPGSISANTGRAPSALTALPVAINVNAGTITSSPGRTPQACKPNSSASVPEATPNAKPRPASLRRFPVPALRLAGLGRTVVMDDTIDGSSNFGGDRCELRLQIEHRNHVCGVCRRVVILLGGGFPLKFRGAGVSSAVFFDSRATKTAGETPAPRKPGESSLFT